ncbi:MAG: hypothetical protein ACRC1R_11480 [Cetobacterium sp.]|uniref:hypothetical protein n=1 Tax=Cetobacterium sp. TaxID=2071632 RepID=UPI003F3CB3DF
MLTKIKNISTNFSHTEIPKVFDQFGKKIIPFYREEISTRTTHGGIWDLDEEYIIGVTNFGWIKYNFIFNFSSGAGVKNHVSDETIISLTYEDVLSYCNTIPELKKAIDEFNI